MKVIRVLNSAFKTEGFKKIILLWLILCIGIWGFGKFTGDTIIMWVGPLLISFCISFILWIIYKAVGGKEKVEDGPNYFN